MKTKLLILLFMACTGLFSCTQMRHDTERFIAFEDYNMHVKDYGAGKPIVIIEAAMGKDCREYDTLLAMLSETARVVSYDRAGLGKSMESSLPRSLPNYAEELKMMLSAGKIKPPYILVGNSMGGFISRYFAHKYPNDVKGIVLVDCQHEDWCKYIRTTHTAEEIEKFNCNVDPELRGLSGISKEEWAFYEENCKFIKEIKIPAKIPVRIITSTQYGEEQALWGYRPDDMEVWAEMQFSLLEDVADAEHIITNSSGHFVHIDEPELIVEEIKELIFKYRASRQPQYPVPHTGYHL